MEEIAAPLLISTTNETTGEIHTQHAVIQSSLYSQEEEGGKKKTKHAVAKQATKQTAKKEAKQKKRKMNDKELLRQLEAEQSEDVIDFANATKGEERRVKREGTRDEDEEDKGQDQGQDQGQEGEEAMRVSEIAAPKDDAFDIILSHHKETSSKHHRDRTLQKQEKIERQERHNSSASATASARRRLAGHLTCFTNYEYLSKKEKQDFENKFAKPKNPSQERYIHTLNDKNMKIIFCCGPAGTGKTFFAAQYAIRHFLLGNYDKLIFSRPTVSVDEDIGFLPGTLEDKLYPWLRPIFDVLHEFVSVKDVQTLIEEKFIEIAPIGYLRGRTFKNTFIIADEMQNCTQNQMKMLLTRLGENSKMVITGDLEQHDRIGEINGLADFLNKLRRKRSNSITTVEFDCKDIVREPVIKEVLEIYAGDVENGIH